MSIKFKELITPLDVLKVLLMPRFSDLTVGDVAARVKSPVSFATRRSTYRTANKLLAQGGVTLANGYETTADDFEAMKDRVFSYDFSKPTR